MLKIQLSHECLQTKRKTNKKEEEVIPDLKGLEATKPLKNASHPDYIILVHQNHPYVSIL